MNIEKRELYVKKKKLTKYEGSVPANPLFPHVKADLLE